MCFFLRVTVKRTLYDRNCLTTDGEVNEQGKGTFRDAYLTFPCVQSWKYQLIHCAWFILSLFHCLHVSVCCRVENQAKIRLNEN